MRTILALFLLLGFAGFAIFGSLAMDHEIGQGGLGCLPFFAKIQNCSQMATPFSSAVFHFNFFKSFISVILPALFSALILFSIFRLLFFSSAASFLSRPAYIGARISEGGPQYSRERFLRWQALHENSPSNSR